MHLIASRSIRAGLAQADSEWPSGRILVNRLTDQSPFALLSVTMEDAAKGFAEIATSGATVQDMLDGIEALRQIPSPYHWEPTDD